MSATSVFTQACPSCEARVPIRDPSLVGRRVDCPRCRYRFRVEPPAADSERPPEPHGPAAITCHVPAARPAPRRRRAWPFTEVPARTVEEGRHFFRRPAHDVWVCLCPSCSEALLFDRRQLEAPWYWPFARRLRCPSCAALFGRQKDIDQPFKGELPFGEPARANYVTEVVIGVVSAVLAAAVLALIGLKG